MAAPVCVPEVEAAGSPACPAHLRRRQELRDGEFWRARERGASLQGGTRLATSPAGKTGHPCTQVTWMGRTILQSERGKMFSFANF